MRKAILPFLLILAVGAMAAEKPANCVKQESQQDAGFFTLIVLPDTQGYADVRHKERQKHWPMQIGKSTPSRIIMSGKFSCVGTLSL